MALNDPIRFALQLDEVVENILEYVASGESLKRSCKLNLVCQKWRSLSYKGLCRASSLPKVCCHCHDRLGSLDDESIQCKMSARKYRESISMPFSPFINLPEVRRPFALEISRQPFYKDLNFIKEFSDQILAVSVNFSAKSSPHGCEYSICDIQLNNNTKISSEVKLENVAKLSVTWGQTRNDRFEKFVKSLVNSSKRLTELKYNYPGDGYYSADDSRVWPVAPPQVTHIKMTGFTKDFETVVKSSLKNLVEIDLNLKVDQTTTLNEPNAVPECDAITSLLKHHSSALRSLKIMAGNTLGRNGILKLPMSMMCHLRVLETDLPIQLIGDPSGKLAKLVNVIGYHPDKEKSGLKISNRFSTTLEVLYMNWLENDSNLGTNTVEANRRQEKQFMSAIKEQSIKNYANLKELSVNKMPFRVGITVMPKLYSSVANITCLRLYFKRQTGTKRPFKADTNDLMKILTGYASNEIPEDVSLWLGLLDGKPNAITSLENLSMLIIKTCKNPKCILGPFVFYAAFLQMRSLESLWVDGGVMVEQEMIDDWKSVGRKINVSRSIHHTK